MQVVTSRFIVATAVASLMVAALVGCTPPAPTHTPTHTRTAQHTPAFASDDEALKAATEAYAAYLKMSDTIAHDGGANPERIKPYVTGEEFDKQLKGFRTFSGRELKSVGETTFDSATLQAFKVRNDGVSEIDIYLCSDVSLVRVLDPKGSDVTPKDRSDRLPLQVSFVTVTGDSKLVLTRSDAWSGKNFC